MGIACAACGALQPVSARECAACHADLRGTLPPEASHQGLERRHLTVVFADLIGSSELSTRVDAEELQHLLQRYHTVCAEAVTEHGGYVAQYLGDGLLAYFGFPSAHEDDARRAILAGHGMRQAVERLNRESGQLLRVRVGVHTGPVVIGEMGAPQRRERLAVGEAVNVAARVQQLARADTVIATAATVQLVEGLFLLRPMGEHVLRGFAEPIVLFEVTGESGARDRLAVALRSGLTPFVGRQELVDRVMETFARAKAGGAPLVVIHGEAGVGKSRCLLALHERLNVEPLTWLECRCLPDTQQRTLAPFVELLETRLGISASDPPEARVSALRAALPETADEHSVDALARLLFIPQGTGTSHSDFGPPRLTQLTFDALLAWLSNINPTAPRVLVIEDLHWADPTTLDFLSLLADHAPPSQLTLVTCRTHVEVAPASTNVERVVIGRLPRDAAAQMVSSLAQDRALPIEVLDRILEKAEGLPLFVEEIARAVLQSGQLRASADRLDLVAPLDTFTVPPTLQETVTARLDRLGEHKTLAQVAAVLGRNFDRSLLAAAYEHIAGASAQELEAGLAALARSHLVEADGRGQLAFRHAMIHEVAYRSLPTATRQFYHRKVALHLTAAAVATSTPTPSSAEMLAHHCAQAGLPQQATQHYAFIGQRAFGAGALREAAAAFDNALTQLARLPESSDRDALEMDLCAALGLAILSTEGFSAPAVERAYRRGLELTERHGRTAPRLLYGIWAFHMLRGNVTETGRIVPLYQNVIDRSSDPLELLVANASLGSRSYFRGRYEEAMPALDRAIELYDSDNPEQQNLALLQQYGFESYVHAPLFRGWARLFMGRVENCESDMAFALNLADRTKHAYVRCSALGFVAPIAHDLSDIARAGGYADDLIRMSQQHGFIYWLGSGLIVKGWTLAVQGATTEGIALLDQGLEIFRVLGARLTYAYYLSYRAEVLLLAKRTQEALQTAEEALRTGEDGLNAMFVPELRRLKGEALHALGEHAMARRELQLSLATTQAQGALLLSLRAATSLHPVLLESGQVGEARTRVEDALFALPTDCTLPEVTRARELLTRPHP